MTPLTLKSIRHLLTTPHVQAKHTEEALALPGRPSCRQSHRPGRPPLGPDSGLLTGEHFELDCSWVPPS